MTSRVVAEFSWYMAFKSDQDAMEREGEDTSKQSASTLRDYSNVRNSLLYG